MPPQPRLGLKTLFDRTGPTLRLPGELSDRYDGDLSIEPTLVYANFVGSIDGVVALTREKLPPSAISLGSQADKLCMALLRGFAGAIVVGANTLRAEPKHVWTPSHLLPELSGQFAALRDSLGIAEEPALYVVTNSGKVPSNSAALGSATIVTTREGATLARSAGTGSKVEVMQDDTDETKVDLDALITLLKATHGRVLTEGGPTLMSQLLQASLIDELFLTVSPLIVGRDESRPTFAEAADLWPISAASELVSLRVDGSHLFCRYKLGT